MNVSLTCIRIKLSVTFQNVFTGFLITLLKNKLMLNSYCKVQKLLQIQLHSVVTNVEQEIQFAELVQGYFVFRIA